MRWPFQKRAERFEPPPRVEPERSEGQATDETVQVAAVQAGNIRETINLL